MELSIANHGKKEPITNFNKDKVFAPNVDKTGKKPAKEAFTVNTIPIKTSSAPIKISSKKKAKEIKTNDLLEKKVIELPECKRPEEMNRTNDPSIEEALPLPKKIRRALAAVLAGPGDHEVRESNDEGSKLQPHECATCCATHDVINFTDEDLLLGSKPHNRPLFVSGYVREYKVNRMLVDGGSAINIMPKSTMTIIGIKLKSSTIFHVIDARTSYSLLLGRPWIHANGVVPSTLHQCLKFYREGVKVIQGDTKPFTEAESHFADANPPEDIRSTGKAAPTKQEWQVMPKKQKEKADTQWHANNVKLLKTNAVLPLTQLGGAKVARLPQGFIKALPKKVESSFLPTKRTEEGFDPNAYKLMSKAGYDFASSVVAGKKVSNTVNDEERNLTKTQKKLKEHGYGVDNNKAGLGFTPNAPVMISNKAKNTSAQHISVSIEQDQEEPKPSPRTSVFDRMSHSSSRTSVFNRIGGQDQTSVFKRLNAPTSQNSVFERLLKLKKQSSTVISPLRRSASEKFEDNEKPFGKRKTTPKEEKLDGLGEKDDVRSLIPSRMKRQAILEVDTKGPLKVRRRTIIHTRQSLCQQAREDSTEEEIQDVFHITVQEGKEDEIPEEDVTAAPPQLEDGGQATVDDLKELNLGTSKEPKPIFVSALLSTDEIEEYYQLLLEYKDVFAWTYKEMPGLDPIIAVHHLAVRPGTRPIKQTQRRYRSELIPQIEVEIDKLIEAGFIREDDFPLPIIEIMVDATTGHEALSFMDGSSGYNQIRMALEDEELTAFRTPKDDLPDEEVFYINIFPTWTMFFDGSARADGAGAGVVFMTPQRQILPYSFQLNELCSNNVAEYQALIIGLQMAINMEITALEVYGDSKLIINQLLTEYEVRKDDLVPYFRLATQLLRKFEAVTLEHVPRKENQMADALANLASSMTLGKDEVADVPVCQRWVIPLVNEMSLDDTNVISVLPVDAEEWRQPLIDYLEHGKLPDDLRHRSEILASWPFDAWGLDVVGPITPKSSAGEAYILAATDYFSKWAEAIPLREVKKETVVRFIKEHIIHRYGVPRYIITDNGKQTPTRATPYSLVYGVEAVLPLESQIPSLRMAIQEGLTDEENAKLRLQELEALDERRLEAQQHLECYQARLSKAFNKKIRPSSGKRHNNVTTEENYDQKTLHSINSKSNTLQQVPSSGKRHNNVTTEENYDQKTLHSINSLQSFAQPHTCEKKKKKKKMYLTKKEEDGAFTKVVHVKPHYLAKLQEREAPKIDHSRPQYLVERWMMQEKGVSGRKTQAFDGHFEFDLEILASHQASSSCPTNSYLQAHANFYSRT
ncbi:hypothetical protein D8674_021822 [Pyrus ussuriensis x Pyrus communis]|uniref:Uncharacterized protein n=1 Tax=Pyrus ussuriensis x Pyrus communis TaxID=2448454 RepID=A0A5N5GWR9_9ROSA|nr:hypothetical protein D8674_021822 [Pyrus ussuriensis x Pyrus communis]